MKSLVALALCLVLASAAFSQNWPSFRGKNGTGVGDGNAPPTTWDVEKSINISWKTPIPGQDGDVFVVKAGPTFELLARNTIGEVIMSTPAIAGKMIIIRGQQHVFGIAQKD